MILWIFETVRLLPVYNWMQINMFLSNMREVNYAELAFEGHIEDNLHHLVQLYILNPLHNFP